MKVRNATLLPFLLGAPLAAQGVSSVDPEAPQHAEQTPVNLHWGDFDSDGLDDALAIGSDGTLTLVRNLGDGSFDDVTKVSGLDALSRSVFGIWQDYDADGDLDLFVGTQRGSSYLLNNQDGVFTDVALESGISTRGTDLSAHWLDYDSDGLLDLHLIGTNDNTLFHGLATGGFEPISLETIVGDPMAGSAIGGKLSNGPSSVDSDDSPAGTTTDEGRTRNDRPADDAGRTSLNSTVMVGGSAEASAGGAINILDCVNSLRDAAGGGCIQASSTSTLGMLYPLSTDFFVDSANGLVGLGTASPIVQFDIAGGVNSVVTNLTSGPIALRTFMSDGSNPLCPQGAQIYTSTNHPLSFATSNNCSMMLLDEAGDLGLGTIAPETELHVFDQTAPTIKIQSDGNNEESGRISMRQSNDTGFDIFYDGTDTTDSLVFQGYGAGTPTSARMSFTSVAPTPSLTLDADLRVDGSANGILVRNAGLGLRVHAKENGADSGDVSTFGPGGSRNNWMTNIAGFPDAGFMGTQFAGTDNAVLSIPAGIPNAGFVAAKLGGVTTAGLNGATGNVSGISKSFIQPHPSDATKQIRYVSLEGPEHGVYFRGTANLVDGMARIEVPESFRLVASAEGLTVNLTPLGPNRGLYVERKGLNEISVRENPGGTGTTSFDYHVMGVRSALDSHQPIEANVNFTLEPGSTIPAGTLPGRYRELMIQNGTLDASGTMRPDAATQQGWQWDGEQWGRPNVKGYAATPTRSTALAPAAASIPESQMQFPPAPELEKNAHEGPKLPELPARTR